MMKTQLFFLFLIACLFFNSSFSFAQNEKPVAVDDQLIIHSYGTYTINVLDNDYDPDGDSIYIDKVYDNDDYEITYTSSQVFVTINSNNMYSDAIKYRILDINGKSDKAYIYINFEEHSEAVHPIADTILVENQVPYEINLIENDIYNGSENLKLTSVSAWYGGNIEILPDSHSVRYTSDAYNGPGIFSYVVEEKGGHQYVSFGGGFIFVSKNEDIPIAKADTFDVQADEIYYLDVLANDQPQGKLEINSLLYESSNISIEDSKIKLEVPKNYSGIMSIKYDVIDSETQLKSMPNSVKIYVSPLANRPTAIADSIELAFSGDTVEIFPLLNDINPLGNPLVVQETGTESVFFNYESNTGWFAKNYIASDTLEGLVSEEQVISIHILPPENIQVQDYHINYSMGDIIDIDPYEGTNIPDTIPFAVSTEIGKYDFQDQTYSFDIVDLKGLLHNEWKNIYELSDKVEIKFNIIDGENSIKVRKYIYVHYDSVPFYSILNINDVKLSISPNGFYYNSIRFPDKLPLISLIQPWFADYTNQDIKRVSGNMSLYEGSDFVYGPLADNYSGNYGEKYYRTWKLSKQEVQYHINNWSDSDYQIPEMILNWPSQETVYLGERYEGADFVDYNDNGIYDPENGDYPKIRGNEAILYIVNDGRYRNRGEGPPMDSLNVDVYTMIYAFDRPETDYFNNTFFIKYKVVNKSNVDYEDFKIGLYADADFENYESYSNNIMYIACDTLLNTFYSYPGMNINQSQSQWPTKPPIALFSLLNNNLDKFTEVVSVGGSYDAFDNYSSQKKYHYLSGTWDENLLYPRPFWSLNAPLNYVYPSHPMDFGADNSIGNPNFYSYNPAQMLGTTDSHTILKGDSKEFEYAIQFYYHPESGYAESIDGALANVADLIQCYHKDSIPGGGSFTGVNENLKIKESGILIYPNPARTTLNIQTNLNNLETYRIYSLQGQLLEDSKFEKQIPIQHLPPGFYFLQLMGENGKMELTRKFVKQ